MRCPAGHEPGGLVAVHPAPDDLLLEDYVGAEQEVYRCCGRILLFFVTATVAPSILALAAILDRRFAAFPCEGCLPRGKPRRKPRDP